MAAATISGCSQFQITGARITKVSNNKHRYVNYRIDTNFYHNYFNSLEDISMYDSVDDVWMDVAETAQKQRA